MCMNFREVVMRGARQQTTLPVNREAYPAAGWRRQTRTKSRLLMELFPPLHLQFEQSFSYTPAYCSDRPLRSRVCRILYYVATSADSMALVLKQHLSASCGSPSVHRFSKKL